MSGISPASQAATCTRASARGPGPAGHRRAADGHLHDLIGVTEGGSREPVSEKTIARCDHLFRTQGHGVRDFTQLPDFVAGTLDAFGVTGDEAAHFVPHRANGMILRGVSAELGLPSAQAGARRGRGPHPGRRHVSEVLGRNSTATLQLAEQHEESVIRAL